MTACSSCGAENPAQAKFCMECAAPLAAPRAAADERKTVTTLFCDLVSFTAMSEAADPEDVDALLAAYSARARRAIESHGGTVEKFIGDAVVGVFGVPAVHEDDPERAVRAALRLLDSLEGLTRPDGSPLQARCGVNTGEALVHTSVDPASGRRFLAGDAVNTAARLQTAAPPGGVAVGALTHELTRHAIVYEELPPVLAKGKAEPVAAWRALRALARTEVELDRSQLTPLVDREDALARLTGLLEESAAKSTLRAVLLVGEPGIGKSRLVAELRAHIDALPAQGTWRLGRCLPYGENTTYSALAEIVRDHTGIRDADDGRTADARLRAAVPAGPDHPWLVNRLRALLGLEAPAASRAENYAGWTLFLESLAVPGPAVLVFEDLHWADDALLAFLDHLLGRQSEVPLLVVACARPELLRRRPGLLEATHAEHIGLEPLTRLQTRGLVDLLLTGFADEARAEVVARCGGNPFFAEQSARFVADGARTTPLPPSVQAVIAARLDALPADQKALIGDAAVMGAVFWDGALVDVAQRDPTVVEEGLDALVAAHLLRHVHTATSGFAGVREFAFVHALARDVAYEQLPRAARARMHAATARWLEERAGGHPEDLAETLAHHFATALELARAAGETELAAQVTGPAARYLAASGERVSNADLEAAERYFRKALDLVPAESPERARIVASLGEALLWVGRDAEAADLLAQAAAGLRSMGDVRGAAVALVRLARAGESVADPATLGVVFRDALALLEHDGPSPQLVRVLIEWGRHCSNAGEPDRALAAFEGALDAAHEIGAPVPPLALNLRGFVRHHLGLPGYLEDFELSLDEARRQGLGVELGRVWGNYCGFLNLQEGPARALEEHARDMEFLHTRGLLFLAGSERPRIVESLLLAGRWQEAAAEAEESLGGADVGGGDDVDGGPDQDAFDPTRFLVAQMRRLALSWRGEPDEGGGDRAPGSAASPTGALDIDEAFGRLIAALVAARSRAEQAAVVLERAIASAPQGTLVWGALLMPEAARLAVAAGDVGLAGRVLACAQGTLPAQALSRGSIAALLAEARGEHEEAAAGLAAATARWHDFGVPYEEGHALLGQGRCLAALGRAPEAAAPLTAAREIFARLGARPALEETEEWLAKVGP